MSMDNQAIIDRIKNDPQFHELVHKRTSFAWILSLLMLLIYFGFIAIIAFNKEVLGQSLSGGVTTVGIPVGLGVILSALALTGIYVVRANASFDRMTQNIVDKVKR